MLSSEFQDFYFNWSKKAEKYSTKTLQKCFDKFFTLYVIYNRLYAEMTFLLVRKGKLSFIRKNFGGKTRKITAFPDSSAARYYVRDYLGSNFLISQIEQDKKASFALRKICKLIQNEQFYIKLDILTGDVNRNDDLKLLENLQSNNKAKKAGAILDLIYSIRCNMFHGNKDFTKVQVPLLRPTIILIEKIIKLLYEKLSTDNNQVTFLNQSFRN